MKDIMTAIPKILMSKEQRNTTHGKMDIKTVRGIHNMTSKWDAADNREKVLILIDDLVSDFLYYNRKEDEDFPVGKIEEMIQNGEITVDEMVEAFRKAIL
jgi:hypothetical protein